MGVLPKLLGKPKPDFLNNALCAYVATFPDQDRLTAHLEQVGSIRHFNQAKALLDEALAAGYSYITSNPAKVDWDSAIFNQAFGEHLRSRYPWLRDGGLSSIRSYCMYLCWKDGYDFSRRT